MSKEKKEKEFQNKLIRDLKSKGINTVNLKQGTFDLIVEGVRPFICEVKQIKTGGLRGFEENEKGFAFTSDQTREILTMNFPPFVVAFYEDDYYFLDPKWVKREVDDLKEFERAIMYFSVRPFPKAITYNEILDKIKDFISQ